MVWILSIVGGFIFLFVLFLLWGALHLRHSERRAVDAIRGIELDEIESLTRECIDRFEQKLGMRLDLADCEDAAQKLDNAFRDPYKLKQAFARPDLYWHFVKPVGACLGELLRRHCKHEWRKRPGEPPFMEVKLADGESECYPFDKMIKQVRFREPGDLVAYVVAARTIDELANEVFDD